MNMKAILILLSALILMTSCHHLEKGNVLKKHHEPAYSYVSFIPMRVGKTTVLIPYTIYDNEDFVLTVEGVYKDELVHETVYVTEACYNNLQQGDVWYKSQDCSFSDDNNTKKKTE